MRERRLPDPNATINKYASLLNRDLLEASPKALNVEPELWSMFRDMRPKQDEQVAVRIRQLAEEPGILLQMLTSAHAPNIPALLNDQIEEYLVEDWEVFESVFGKDSLKTKIEALISTAEELSLPAKQQHALDTAKMHLQGFQPKVYDRSSRMPAPTTGGQPTVTHEESTDEPKKTI